MEEYRRVAAFNRHCGVDVHEIGPSVVKELFPLARTDDLLAGFLVKEDGRANPVDVTMALARGARMHGAKLIEEVPVTGFVEEARRGDRGRDRVRHDRRARYVVNCAGMWARQLAEKAGVNVPLQAAEHYYLITDRMPGVESSLPVIEDPASYGYFREEVGGLLIGLFEPVCAPWNVSGHPGGLFVRRDHARLGSHGAVRRKSDAARAGHARNRDREVFLRARELHAGSASDRRGGAGAS